jgi:hypothetical protein
MSGPSVFAPRRTNRVHTRYAGPKDAPSDDLTCKAKVINYYDELKEEKIAALTSPQDVERVFKDRPGQITYAQFAYSVMGFRVDLHMNDFVIFMMLLKKATAITYSLLVTTWEKTKEFHHIVKFLLDAGEIVSNIPKEVQSLIPARDKREALRNLFREVYMELSEIIPNSGHAPESSRPAPIIFDGPNQPNEQIE